MHVDHHPLIKEFPELRERIHALKVTDTEFRKLFEEYGEIDKEICRIEEDIEPASDARAEILKKKRVFLKDALYQLLVEN
jgi:uncharacterized protein YdcH (DUF465 family)